MFGKLFKHRYYSLPTSETSSTETVRPTGDLINSPRHHAYWSVRTWWIFTIVNLLVAATTVCSSLYLQISHGNSCSFATDLEDVRPYVRTEQRVFSGALDYDNDSGRVYRKPNPTGIEYFGPPSPAIDQAWKELLRGEFPAMTPTESERFTPRLKTLRGDGHYRFELDVFHSLHCMNAIRKKIDHAYYGNIHGGNSSIFPPGWHRVHMDHCLDQIMQSIMCQADLSPVPLYSWDGFYLALGVGQEHTCREWSGIRKWLDRRNAEVPALEEED